MNKNCRMRKFHEKMVRLVSLTAIMLLFGLNQVFAQQDSTRSVRAVGMNPVSTTSVQSSQTMPLVTIRGTVLDENGLSVIGASVYLIRGTERSV